MRKKEKEITDRAEIDLIIQKALICHLSCSLAGQPYTVPLSFGYDGSCVYFHSAPVGKKYAILKKNPRVCLTFVDAVELIKHFDQACDWSFIYRSVIATGLAEELSHHESKVDALNQIMCHYSDRTWTFPETELSRISVWKVPLTTVTGKRSP